MENFISQNLPLLVVATVTIVSLIVLVIYQANKIKEMARPRYGFLGKPLGVVLAFGLLAGGFGLITFVNQQPTEIRISNANFVLEMNVIATQLGRDQYRFNLIPVVDSVDWGVDGYKFTVYWSITNVPTQITKTQVETDLDASFRGGFITNLERGLNIVKATIFIEGNRFEKEIEIEI